jgi:glycosyltransferase involved in cell wall biosynthesis
LVADYLLHASVFRHPDKFDVVHTHTDYRAFAYAEHTRMPLVTTLHGRIDTLGMAEVLRAFPAVHLVSISQAQRAPAPDAHWAETIYHGLDLGDYPFGAEAGEELLFLGRFSPKKAPHVAIDLAVAAGMRIALAGRVDPVDQAYFDQEVKPRMAHPLVRFAGEVAHDEKVQLLRSARALLFPIDWPEPFGLVMIEAMACVTPVVARPKGSAPEVIVHGVTGILADDQNALVEAVKAARRLDRRACRRHVEAAFSRVTAMIDRYEALYEGLRGGMCA